MTKNKMVSDLQQEHPKHRETAIHSPFPTTPHNE